MTLATACSAYRAKQTPGTFAESMPYRQSVGSVLLGVDSYHRSSRQQDFFDEDLAAAGVLPLLAALRNQSARPLRIETENFKLVLAGNHAIGAASGSEIAALLQPQAGVADYAAAGVGMLGGLGGTIGAIVGRVVSLVASGLLGRSRSDELQARDEDYSRKELKPITLGHGQATRGFLYFVVPSGTPDFDDALLTFSVFEDRTETLKFEIRMTGLGYKGRPAEEPDTADRDGESKSK